MESEDDYDGVPTMVLGYGSSPEKLIQYPSLIC
jgi:hypothetical protein